MFLACKDFALAPQVLLSKALWQLVSILRAYFSIIRAVREEDREITRALQYRERNTKSGLRFLPVLHKSKPLTFSKT